MHRFPFYGRRVLSFLAGLGLGFSLIVAIGAQNLFVLRQGLRRDRVLLTAAICALSDALLIVLGLLMISGVWEQVTAWIQTRLTSSFTTVL